MKRSLKNIFLVSLAATSVLALPSCVLAAEHTEDAAKTNVLKVTQTKQTKLQTPTATIVLTQEDFERGGYKSVVEALEDCPGITINRPGYGDGEQRILINGDSRVLVLMDGRRLNVDMGVNQGNGSFDAATIPDPELIEKIEIIKGASGSMYGAGAVGGVINIITKRAQGNYVKLDGAMGQQKTYKYNGTLSAKRGKYGLLITGGTYHQKDMRYKDYGSGETETLKSSKWELDSFGVKLDREIGEDKLLTLHYQHSFKEGRTPGAILWGDTGSELERLNNAISLRYDWNKEEANSGFATLYHSYYTSRHKIQYADNAFYKITANEKRDGLDIQQNFVLNPRNTLAVGATWRHDTIDSGLFSDSGDRSIDNKGLFVSDNWNFAKDFSLTSGLRYDHYDTVGGKTTASLGLNKLLDSTSHLYANWGTVFNAPSANQLFDNKLLPGSFSSHYLGHEDLRPETGYTWGIGYDKQFDDKTDLNLYYFQSRLNDALAMMGYINSGNYVYEATNLNKEKKHGVTLALKHKFSDRWKGSFSYSYTDVDYDYARAAVYDSNLNMYPHQFKLGVDYTLARLQAGLRLRAATGGDTETTSTWTAYANKAYLTMDLALNYKFNKDWTVYGKIYNLTNAAYAETSGSFFGSNAYPMSGRYFVLGVQYLF